MRPAQWGHGSCSPGLLDFGSSRGLCWAPEPISPPTTWAHDTAGSPSPAFQRSQAAPGALQHQPLSPNRCRARSCLGAKPSCKPHVPAPAQSPSPTATRARGPSPAGAREPGPGCDLLRAAALWLLGGSQQGHLQQQRAQAIGNEPIVGAAFIAIKLRDLASRAAPSQGAATRDGRRVSPSSCECARPKLRARLYHEGLRPCFSSPSPGAVLRGGYFPALVAAWGWALLFQRVQHQMPARRLAAMPAWELLTASTNRHGAAEGAPRAESNHMQKPAGSPASCILPGPAALGLLHPPQAGTQHPRAVRTRAPSAVAPAPWCCSCENLGARSPPTRRRVLVQSWCSARGVGGWCAGG